MKGSERRASRIMQVCEGKGSEGLGRGVLASEVKGEESRGGSS